MRVGSLGGKSDGVRKGGRGRESEREREQRRERDIEK